MVVVGRPLLALPVVRLSSSNGAAQYSVQSWAATGRRLMMQMHSSAAAALPAAIFRLQQPWRF